MYEGEGGIICGGISVMIGAGCGINIGCGSAGGCGAG